MAQLTGEAVRKFAHEAFDYELSDRDAHFAANTAGAMLTLARQLATLGLSGIGPAFGYPNLMAEATHLTAKKV